MIFVLLFVTLAAADATVIVHTPLHENTDKEAIFFEVQGNRVARLRAEAGDSAYARLLAGLPRLNWYNFNVVLRRIYDFSADVGNHEVSVAGSVTSGNLGLRYRLKPEAGDTGRVVRRPSSELQRTLADADTSRQFVAFLVHSDALELFREARRQANRRGFQTGWEPIQDDADGVEFSSHGRSVGVQ